MRSSLLLAVAALAGACAGRPQQVRFPEPFEDGGVRVEVESVVGAAGQYRGLRGTAWNVGFDRVEDCVLSVEGLTTLGEVAARAQVRTGPIEPGESVPWEARFPLAADVRHVPRPRVKVFRAGAR